MSQAACRHYSAVVQHSAQHVIMPVVSVSLAGSRIGGDVVSLQLPAIYRILATLSHTQLMPTEQWVTRK